MHHKDMSRNLRQKHPRTPVKPTKGRRRRVSETSESSLDLSDESGYSAVDEISDSSDDDEEDVAAAEEENLLKEAQVATPTTPRPRYESNDDEDDDEEDQDGDDEGAHAEEDDGWAGILSDVDGSHVSIGNLDSDAPTIERHVHFADSDSDSTDTDVEDHADIFPDLFVSQNSLDPTFRREIENDPDDSSGSGSFWDFNYHAYNDSENEDFSPSPRMNTLVDYDLENLPRPAEIDSQTPTAASTPAPSFEDSQELDGYETDGDTTEEDIPEPLIHRRSRRPSNPISEASDSDVESPTKAEKGQPRVGRVNLDRPRNKPTCIWNHKSKKLVVFTPDGRRQLDIAPEQFDIPWAVQQQSSPIFSNSANLMMSAMFSSGTFGDFVGSMGPAEAFFPGNDESSTASSTHDEEDDAEKQLNLDDFLRYGDSSDEEEDDIGMAGVSTPARPTTASSEMDNLPQFNSNTVAAFRRNQIDQQLILSNKATQDSLAFSGPYNVTALRGLRSDRFETAAVPLTPVRRHKHRFEGGRSPLDGLSSKRKASSQGGNVHHIGHKRHRSISEVSHLQIR